jgi:hypothetical protein
MAEPLDRLFDLLPVYYRRLDAAQGGPLRALLQLIAAQAAAVEADVAQLYDDLFIETCQTWVAPYLGDLVGYEAVEAPTAAGAAAAPAAVLSPRADVSNTIAVRRRKGTLAVLEQLARDVAGWPAVAVELADRVGHFVSVRFANAPVPWAWRRSPPGGFLDVRDPALARELGTPFDRLARTADVRRVNSTLHPGQASVTGVAVFAYRLQAVPVGPTPAKLVEPRRFTFDPLGYDVPLFTRPTEPPDRDAPPATPLDVPAPILRGALPSFGMAPAGDASSLGGYYGADKSFAIYLLGPDKPPHPGEKVFAASLDKWDEQPDTFPPDGHVAVDPELGRLLLAGDLDGGKLHVSYHYGTPDTLGAGGHPWGPLADDAPKKVVVEDGNALQGAIDNWDSATYPSILIELSSSDMFELTGPTWTVPAGCMLHVRAGPVVADGGPRTARPILRPAGAAHGPLTVKLGPGHPADPDKGRPEPVRGGRLVLEGLLLADLDLVFVGPAAAPGPKDFFPADVLLRQVTLAPSVTLAGDSAVPPTPAPRLRVEGVSLRLRAERCLLPPIYVSRGDLAGAPVTVEVTDSVLDAGDPGSWALADPAGCHAPAVVSFHGATVNGRVEVHAVDLAENSLFLGRVHVARRQSGCVRYCYVEPDGSRTPRRHQCQPDLAVAVGQPASSVRPAFTSTRYGAAAYFQLAASAPPEITGGADDQGEMGAYHRLQQGRRAARLRSRLAEFTPTGFDVALLFVT